MAKKLCIVVSLILILALIGFVIADICISGKITSFLSDAGSEAAVLNEVWREIQNDRLSTAIFATLFFSVILVIVLKIGPEKKAAKGISQSEAQKIAVALMDEYRKSGIYVEANEEDDEDIVTEMEMPEMKAVRFEGDKVVIEWKPVSNATGYYVWRKREDEEWCKIKKIKKAVCKYKDSDIQEETHYTYAVKSYYESDGVRVISKKDPLGLDLFVPKMKNETLSKEVYNIGKNN